jgi:high-affinity K+ transport system ATPase subunit B
MIDTLAEMEAEKLVIAWVLTTCGLLLAAVGIAAVAMLTATPMLALAAGAVVIFVSWIPTALLVAVAKRQESNAC